MKQHAAAKSLWADRYEIKRLLGEGERKQVYLATDHNMDRSVALALIEAEVPAEGQLTVTEWEKYVMGQLSEHPHIVTVYDVGEEDGQAYLSSQYMRGGDLRGLLRRSVAERRQLPLSTVVRMAGEVCDALAYAHGKGFIHRDVQPGNIWLDSPDGTAHLGDFDLAVAPEGTKAPPPSIDIVTTRAYMPPEEARGDTVDARSDLYSLGATLYEQVTGRPPFEGTTEEITEQHLAVDPAPPSRLRSDLPPALEALILRLLAKSPDDRPSDSRSVLDALHAIGIALGSEQFDLDAALLAGESVSLEFKASLRWDYDLGTKNAGLLQAVVAKAVAGLMNAKGGTLLIGVHDKGTVVGIEQDYTTLSSKPTRDGWEQAFAQAMIKHNGHDAAASVSVTYRETAEGTVAVVRCPARSKPTFTEMEGETRFFARVANSTRPLPGPFAESYIQETWPR